MKNQVFLITYFILITSFASETIDIKVELYDSILENVNRMKKDSNCVSYILKSARELKKQNKYQAISLLEESEEISKKINYILGIALSNLYMSEIERIKGDNDLALKKCLLAISLLDSINYIELLPSAYNDLAQIYFDIGRKEEAFENNKLAYVIAEKNMNQHQMGRSLTNIGVYYADSGEHEKALSYFKKCEIIALNTKSDFGYSLTLINLGSCYLHLKQFNKALSIYNKAIKICKEKNLTNNLVYAFLKKAELFNENKDYQKVELWLKKAESFLIKVDDIKLEKSVNAAFYELYETKNNSKLALKYYKRFNDIEEEIKQNNLSKTIAELKAKNENIKREKEIALLKKSNEMETTWNLGLFIGFSFLLFSSIMIYLELRQRKIKKDQELSILKQLRVEDELEMLQTKINPHFLYNALNSISSLAEDEPEQAEKMVLSLAELFRYSINSEEGHFTKVSQAIEICEKYLEIEKVRYGDRLNYNFQIEKETEELLIPRFLLQPLVENAIKHGISKIRKGEIKLKINKKEEYLNILLHDNGPPFPNIFLSGYGSTNIKKKLKILYKAQHEIQYLNTPEKMVKITIINPYTVAPKYLTV